jgi:hypothetical protein
LIAGGSARHTLLRHKHANAQHCGDLVTHAEQELHLAELRTDCDDDKAGLGVDVTPDCVPAKAEYHHGQHHL